MLEYTNKEWGEQLKEQTTEDGIESMEVFAYIYPVVNDLGKVVGEFGFVIPLASFHEYMDSVSSGDIDVVLYDFYGVPVYQSENTGKLTSKMTDTLYKKVVQKENRTLDSYKLGGNAYVARYCNIDTRGLTGVLFMSRYTMYGRAATLISPVMVLFIVTILVLGVAMHMVARKMIDPIRKVADSTRELSKGNYYGWKRGNELLIQTGNICKEKCVDEDLCGRVTADVFVGLVSYDKAPDLITVAVQIVDKIKKLDVNTKLYPHVGVYLCQDAREPVNIMCDYATSALKLIKGNVVESYSFYDNDMEKKTMNRHFVESEMDKALKEKQFFIVLQPKYDMVNNKIVGAEALVRWEHPERGLIRPDEFVPILEKDGFILRLDEFVWEETCVCHRRWLDAGISIPVSVNVSRMHIFDKGFITKLDYMISKYNIPKELLELEFTESALLENVDILYNVMRKLKERGYHLVMDDFASGYSSLNMLKALSFDVVKLDKEFLDEVTVNGKCQKLVAGTIDLLKGLDMKIVGEGIETKEQVTILKDAGLIVAQGYYYYKPLKVEEFENLIF